MIGNQIAAGQALTIANDSFNGNGSTVAFTLSQTVSSVNDIEVLVDNVQQSPYDSSYSVNGTTLTFSGAPSTGTNNIYVIYHGSKHITTNQVIPDDGSVTDAKITGMSSSKLTGALPALDGSALTGAGTVKHMQFANIAGNGSATTTSLSYVATPVTITVAAADVAKCTRLVVQHAGSTRTDRNTHAHQQRRFQRTAPSAVNFDDYIIGSVAGGSESLDNVSMTIVDANLGTGDHTYTVYVRKASGNNVYASSVYTQYRPSTIVVWGF